MKYLFYPGCSLNRTALPYDMSIKAITGPLGIELVEVDDWNCCGATEYATINRIAAYALIARNLALASNQDGNGNLVVPCSACLVNLKKIDHYMATYPEVYDAVNESLSAGGLSYEPGSLEIRHLLDVVVHDVGLEAVNEKVDQDLSNLRLAPYYGCLLVRPIFGDEPIDNPEYPVWLDNLLSTMGATVIDFPLKTHCCGGHMTQISADTAYELIRRILYGASNYEADAIVSICPMCQLNLDAYQSQVNRHFRTKYKLPVLYFTQLIGLALGIAPQELGIGKEIVPATSVLRKLAMEPVPQVELVPAHERPDDKSLPMPSIRDRD